MKARVDFDVPHGTESGRCRLCKAEILWVKGANGMMPLDASSAVLVGPPGQQTKRAESHFAHCEKAEQARRIRPKALCMVKACGSSISRTRHFCPECIARAPRSLRSLLQATSKEYGPKSNETRQVRQRVLTKILESREADKVHAPGLFAGPEPAPDDPG